MLFPVMEFAFALLLGYVFFMAGYHKLVESDRFVHVIREYDVVPTWAEVPILYTLGFLEIAVFAMLLSPFGSYAAAIIIVLLSLYIAVMGRTLIVGKRLADCGCGLPGSEGQVSVWLIVRNLVLIGLATTLLNVNLVPSLVWLLSVPLALFLIGLYVVMAQIHQNQIKLDYLKDYGRG